MITSLSFSLSSRRCFSWSQTSQLIGTVRGMKILEVHSVSTQYRSNQLISVQFRISSTSIEIASGVMAAVMVESGWDYFTCVLTFRLKKTWSSWAKALRSWARVLWLGEALGGTGKSEGIFQTWLRKAEAKSFVRLGLVHLCKSPMWLHFMRDQTLKVGSRNRAIGFSRVLFPLLLQLEPKMLEAFSSALVQLNSRHSRH